MIPAHGIYGRMAPISAFGYPFSLYFFITKVKYLIRLIYASGHSRSDEQRLSVWQFKIVIAFRFSGKYSILEFADKLDPVIII